MKTVKDRSEIKNYKAPCQIEPFNCPPDTWDCVNCGVDAVYATAMPDGTLNRLFDGFVNQCRVECGDEKNIDCKDCKINHQSFEDYVNAQTGVDSKKADEELDRLAEKWLVFRIRAEGLSHQSFSAFMREQERK
jgi:hypothetical protein